MKKKYMWGIFIVVCCIVSLSILIKLELLSYEVYWETIKIRCVLIVLSLIILAIIKLIDALLNKRRK